MKVSQIGSVVSNLVSLAIVVAIILSLFSLLWGGIRWIIAGGEKSKVDAARNTIFGAIIGLCIVFLAYFILDIILGLFNISLKQITLPSLPLFGK